MVALTASLWSNDERQEVARRHDVPQEQPTMECDMLVALSRATRDGGTLFAYNCDRIGGEETILLRVAGRDFSPGEQVRIGDLILPQVRRTWTVLATRSPRHWGYLHGLNEHGVSIGLTTIRTKRHEVGAALTGPDLVRLALERATSARQAVDLATDLASRHGQGDADAEQDPAFLIADGREAFVVEMFGPHWAVQRVGAVRAVSDACQIRQDWDYLSHGLADLAIERGWWPADGSKLDFAGVVAPEGGVKAASLRRWGRATLLLEQHNGAIDLPLLRRMLSDLFESCTNVESATRPSDLRTVVRLIAQTGTDAALPIAWYSFGPPGRSVYFPLFLVGELPCYSPRMPPVDSPDQSSLRAALDSLQERLDRETGEFLVEAAELRSHGQSEQLPRQAELFVRHTLECWENLCLDFAPVQTPARRVAAPSELHSAGAWS